MNRIHKLYISNFLTGLIFWYGIEKLFMRSIGIDAVGIGIVTAASGIFTILFDVPAGLIADRWSRKGQLIISALCLAISSLLFGLSTGLTLYVIGNLFYACYLVNTSGTYQAITYDILHEEGRAKLYSKIMGKAYALFLCGAGVGNVASGIIGRAGLEWSYFLSMIPPILNIIVLVSINEPTFHKDQQKEKFLRQFADDLKVIARIKLVRSLALLWVVFALIGTFTLDFGQLFVLEFTDSPILLGWSWAIFAFALAMGSFIAHRLQHHVAYVILGAMVLAMSLGLSQQVWALVPFMIYAVANTTANMLIEAKVQDNTPSAVRTSILSFLSMLGRLFGLPFALLLGWLIRTYDIFWAVRLVALIALATAAYWLLVGRPRLRASRKPATEVAAVELLLTDK
jgi:MFS family permease